MSALIRRHFRRFVFDLLIAAALLWMAIEWSSNLWYRVTEVMVRLLHLRRVEEWLRRTPLWVGFILCAPLGYGFVLFKVYEYHLIWDGHFILATMLGLVFKFTYATVFHFLIHIYAEHLLAFSWIRWLYHRYKGFRLEMRRWMKRQVWYHTAVRVKKQAIEYLGRRSRFKFARWWVKRSS